jgi:hypothetical protein
MSLLVKRICHSLTSWACKHIENPSVEEVVIRPYTLPTIHHFLFHEYFSSEAPARHPFKAIFRRRRFNIIDSMGSLQLVMLQGQTGYMIRFALSTIKAFEFKVLNGEERQRYSGKKGFHRAGSHPASAWCYGR